MKQIQLLRGSRSQGEVAKDLRITCSHYNYIENGRRIPSLSTAMRIAEYYKVPMESIFHCIGDEIHLIDKSK